jgi:hypothetical protein
MGGNTVDSNTTVANAASTTANVVANAVPANAAPAANEAPLANAVPANDTPPANAANEVTETRAEKRIRQLVAKEKDAAAEAAYWRGVAEGRANATPGAAPIVPGATAVGDEPPKPEQFESYDDYLYADFEHRRKKQDVQANIAKAQAETHERFMEKVNKEAETDPEVLDILQDRTFLPLNNPMSTLIANAIKETEVPTDVMRHLHSNRGELQKLYGMTPFAVAREIGKIEQRLINLNKPEPVRKISQAPKPLKTLEPLGSQVPDLDNMPIEDFVKKRNAEQFGNNRRR